MQTRGEDVIQTWPEESREAAQMAIDQHGEPHGVTESMLVRDRVSDAELEQAMAGGRSRQPDES